MWAAIAAIIAVAVGGYNSKRARDQAERRAQQDRDRVQRNTARKRMVRQQQKIEAARPKMSKAAAPAAAPNQTLLIVGGLAAAYFLLKRKAG